MPVAPNTRWEAAELKFETKFPLKKKKRKNSTLSILQSCQKLCWYTHSSQGVSTTHPPHIPSMAKQ